MTQSVACINASGPDQSRSGLICPRCETEGTPGSRYCQYCGTKLKFQRFNLRESEKQPNIKQFPPVLTVKETAELLRISRSTVYELIKQGEIPFFQIGNKKRFRTEQVLNWAAEREGK